MTTATFTKHESAVRSYCRDYPVVFHRAQGAELFTEDSRRYIDFLAGAGTLNYGHNPRPLIDALMGYLQEGGILHGLDLHTRAKANFIESFVARILKPRGLDYRLQFTGPTGTNAVEAALKLARKVTGRSTIAAFTGGFHGMTMGALACTANERHRAGAGVDLPGVIRLPYQGWLGQEGDTIDYLRRLLEDPSAGVETPAAVLIETIQGEGGVNVASYEWLRQLQGLCREHGILLIVDDIQVGCGRTGTFFSWEGQEIEPDIILLSKSLSGSGQPMAMVLMKPELDQWLPGEHNGTFRGNNAAFVTATAALEHYWCDSRITHGARARSRMLRESLTALRNRFPELHVRGRGMVWGVEMPNGEIAGQCVAACFKEGLLMENCGRGGAVMKFLGPVNIPEDTLAEGLQIFHDAVAATLGAGA